MTGAQPGHREPTITINGAVLSSAEAMTVRVALSSFDRSLADGLGDDERGRAITAGYQRCINTIHAKIAQGAP